MRFNEPVRRVEKRFNDLIDATPAKPILPSFIKHKIRELMSREMHYVKDADKIQRAIDEMIRVLAQLAKYQQVPVKKQMKIKQPV